MSSQSSATQPAEPSADQRPELSQSLERQRTAAEATDGIEELLGSGEQIFVAVRQHPVVLVRPLLWAAGFSILWIAAATGPGDTGGRIMDLLTLTVFGTWLWVLWSELERRHNRFIVTNARLLKYEGIITKTSPSMRLTKITDVTLRRSPTGRLLRYGEIIIENAAQDQALRSITYLTHPTEVNSVISTLIFGKDATKAVKGRSTRPRVAKGAAIVGGFKSRLGQAMERTRSNDVVEDHANTYHHGQDDHPHQNHRPSHERSLRHEEDKPPTVEIPVQSQS